MVFIQNIAAIHVKEILIIMHPGANETSAHKHLIIESRKNDFGKIIQRVL